jgi:hypothetical protein
MAGKILIGVFACVLFVNLVVDKICASHTSFNYFTPGYLRNMTLGKSPRRPVRVDSCSGYHGICTYCLGKVDH